MKLRFSYSQRSSRPRKDHSFAKLHSLVAVDGISFGVPKGEIFGLLGPNGAGKTTTIKMLCTLITPSSGDAFVNGFSVIKDQQRVRESLGVMLTGERTLYRKLTAWNLEYFAALYHMESSYGKKRIGELLELVGLTEREGTLVENFRPVCESAYLSQSAAKRGACAPFR